MTQPFKKLRGLTGMHDVLPDQSAQWEQLEEIVREWLASYGYRNMRTPILEYTQLFARGIGEVTDIVEKEMYSFTDSLNGDQLTMRPEFTAGVVRSAIEHNLLYERPQRIYSIGPVFRHERPQRGRYRQFHQIDVEALGFPGPDVDAEMIIMLGRLWQRLGLTDVRLEINSLGQSHERAAHRKALIEYLEKHQDILDDEAKRRMYTNPLRVLDTKNPELQEMANAAPSLFGFLGEESLAHYEGVCQRLDAMGIEYTLNPRMVRGLDYYNLTVFEWVTDRLGAQGTVCGGGRYDGLFELLGGKPTPGIGFAIGVERLLELVQQQEILSETSECDIYMVYQNDAGQQQAMVLAEQIRDVGLRVVVHAGPKSMRAQFRRADNSGALAAVILGQSELETQQASVKWLRAPVLTDEQTQQEQVDFAQCAQFLKSRIGD
ncbi:MAG TPA: histidine--tRNA ligase [Paenalcaligenes sp.]|nr:histidine--tRNA ligase [Paenalcaligenes sp.]